MARLKYWLWLSGIMGMSTSVKYRLSQEPGPEALFFADERELEVKYGLPDKLAKRLADKSMAAASRAMEFCTEHEIQLLTIQDAQYPERLRNIPDPPVVLYVWGRLPAVDERVVIAVVGTRDATPYGIRMSSLMGGGIAQAGGIVVSGLTGGCDTASAEAALRAGGTVIGVLGTGVDIAYPASNRGLFEAVRAKGALVSEYPPGTRGYPANFRARNRILSGLSLGVVVTEAPLRSGTRITAGLALEQGRDVFAVPGNADAYASAGCNALISEGAAAVTDGRRVVESYTDRRELMTEPPGPGAVYAATAASAAERAGGSPRSRATHIKKEIDKPKDIVYIDTEKLTELPSAQRRILSVMTRPDMHADEIIEAAGLSARETLAGLTMLMVSGYVAQGAGRRYTRKK